MKRNSVSLIAGSAFLLVACTVSTKSGTAETAESFRQLHLFGDVFERVRAEYVEEVSDQELIAAAINGMLTSLDPHSSYLDPERHRDMQVHNRGAFGGLGIEVTMENGLVKVVSPIDGTPAYEAGILPGDLITEIDGEAVMGLSLSEAVDKMRGLVDTSIELKVVRESAEDILSFSIKRAIITVSPVRARSEGDIGYLRVTSFTEQTTDGLEKEITDLYDEIGDQIKGFVLDLRANPGGLLDQAVSVSDLFLEGGEIVSTRGRDTDSVQRFNARSGDAIEGLPLVVLINGGSASASEIVAGALKDHGRAIIMGTTSFGKGSVQTIMPLPGHGAIRLTTARYYTPSGTSIQATGIEPDIFVPVATVEVQDSEGRQREADLRLSLQNEQSEDEAGGEADGSESSTSDDDYQLQRALDLIRGVALYRTSLSGQ